MKIGDIQRAVSGKAMGFALERLAADDIKDLTERERKILHYGTVAGATTVLSMKKPLLEVILRDFREAINVEEEIDVPPI